MTKRSLRDQKISQAAYQDGYDKGSYAGLMEGARIERERLKKDTENARLQATTQLLQQAGQFQECITKLVLSINSHL